MLVVPVIILSLIIQAVLKSTYKKYSGILNSRGITGAHAAQIVLSSNNVAGVNIEHVQGEMTDHYDPRSNTIRLSDGVYESSTIAAVGIACHEAGHAVQHAQGYFPIKIRNSILPVCNFASKISIPMLFLGYLLGADFLCTFGVILFGSTALFQFLTLPVEFNASKRAIEIIEGGGILSGDESTGAKKVLRVAALTYVAAFLTSAMQLLRIILRFSRRRR
jgi:Zn-dependent membrane protease YugP